MVDLGKGRFFWGGGGGERDREEGGGGGGGGFPFLVLVFLGSWGWCFDGLGALDLGIATIFGFLLLCIWVSGWLDLPLWLDSVLVV